MRSSFRVAHSFWNVLTQKINYLQRLIGTALGFSLFGVGGLILCLTVFPLVMLWSRDPYQRQDHVRRIIRESFKGYLKTLEFLGLLQIKCGDLSSLQEMKGCLVICNHPTLIDVVVIMSQLKNVQCVVKSKLWENPFIGGVVRAAGYIRNDINPETFLKECQEHLTRGENIIIFPEGTRSIPGQPMELRRGFANLALAARANIQALLMDCHPVSLIKGQKWYKIPPKRIVFHLQVGGFFPIENYLQDNQPRSLRVRALFRDVQQYYNRYLGYE
jgi:1-acyl-sn-glycerol-3-phosphate acyltransferase